MSLFLVIPMISRPAKLASCRSFLLPICMPENSGGVGLKSVRRTVGNLVNTFSEFWMERGQAELLGRNPGSAK
jgi:hypothetical protein